MADKVVKSPGTLMFGRQITAPADPLHRIDVGRVHRGITAPKPDFRRHIERLRTVASVDVSQYRQLKKTLPYLVCGSFHPAIRRKEHFAAIDCFVLDLDHLGEAGLSVEGVRKRLSAAPGPLLGFVSPGGDGFKVLFRLAEACRDAARFHAFYQRFARFFAHEQGLEAVVDYQTCDVTRACFMSYDAEAFYQVDAVPVRMEAYLEEMTFPEASADEHANTKSPAPKRSKASAGPDDDTLARIRDKLRPGRRAKPKKTVVQPEEITEAIAYFEANLSEYGLRLATSEAISYGRRLKIDTPQKQWWRVESVLRQAGLFHSKNHENGQPRRTGRPNREGAD